MRFGIIGTGALGGLVAGYLRANDEDVRCLDIDPAVIEAIDERGLRVSRPNADDITAHPVASTSPDDLGTVDVAFVLTKSIDTDEALDRAEPMIGPDTTIVTIQNGLRNVEIVGRHVPTRRVLGGCTRMGSNRVRPGHVREMGHEPTVIGGEDYETATRVAETLEDAGLETIAVDDPTPYIWDKQFMNVAIKPLAALTELRNGPMIEYAETRGAMRQLIEEAMAVARAQGIEIVSDDPVEDVIDRELDAAGYDKKSSILEDVENERPTEVRHINGAVVELGEELGIETPYNRIATQLMSGKERSYVE